MILVNVSIFEFSTYISLFSAFSELMIAEFKKFVLKILNQINASRNLRNLEPLGGFPIEIKTKIESYKKKMRLGFCNIVTIFRA